MAKRCRLRRDKHHSRQQARVLIRQIKKSLKQDQKERVAAAGAEITSSHLGKGASVHSFL